MDLTVTARLVTAELTPQASAHGVTSTSAPTPHWSFAAILSCCTTC
ncbi:hypothetical protein LV779_21900 [Streptomyces thinghirensis]|nr:hypothetical protein [Streptomyces thinghirensis]